ncbi:putative guanine nucleotide-binding protein alpha-1 subunit [Neoconidiobolus thromboides FSU 785]|nr:putative guanine nucleotide-binding protein alpha-1 subunit [Neoconidiobolus thromboides FSU 785]
MGCSQSTDNQGFEQNDTIENQLRADRASLKNEVKLLLLGAGESGKSTIVKQMELIHNGSYPDNVKNEFKEVIFSNTIVSMRVILEAMSELGISLGDDNNQTYVELIFQLPNPLNYSYLPPNVSMALIALWSDNGVKLCVDRSREFQLNDSAAYYFDSVERFSQPNYLPTDQDVLRSRVKTSGIIETNFQVGKLTYRMVDVGGQRSERKKWIHCFEGVTSIIFMVAINEYDQTLIEDENMNRMHESFTLFDSVCNSKWFQDTAIILFLNKIDILKNKVLTSPVSNYFPEYQGGTDFQSACEFFKGKFLALNKNVEKQIYCHFTCATDTKQIKFVMSAVNDIVVQINLRACGLL